ncbi:MAG: dephospho-CoA kinase [Planctomycetota bacterium]|jgi:dephospho-CoA kinase|nr:dephospho-CoA kinase [Planctomycetota bacterium]
MTLATVTPRIVGITGLPCAGKSYLAQWLAAGKSQLGPGRLLQADDIGHQVLAQPDSARALAQHFGPEVLSLSGQVDRRQLAKLVFSSPGALAWLESFLHPQISQEIIKHLETGDQTQPVFLEAALLLAVDLVKLCQLVILVEAPLSVRQERASRRGWDAAELARREVRLTPLFSAENLARFPVRICRVNNGEDEKRLESDLSIALSAAAPPIVEKG